MRNGNLIFKLVVLGFLLVIASSCSKDNDSEPSNPTNGHTTAVFNPKLKYGSMTDQDGNTYRTITIGTQTWMAENLRTTKYRNGDAITNVTGNAQWGSTTSGAYCYYNNTNSLDTIALLGGLYNWYAVSDNRSIAPKGWHVPSEGEWNTLVAYLGGDSIAGYKMKQAPFIEWDGALWIGIDHIADNSSGFTANPGGWRWFDTGRYVWVCYDGAWWAVTECGVPYAGVLFLEYFESAVTKICNYKGNGYSVRCIRD
ncbi:MAG: hypothetical protein HOO91_05955 [Bacteroidales bacterium]|nr:hypothetical protein [Bacteroidales bacterium]